MRALLEAALTAEGFGRDSQDVIERIKSGGCQLWQGADCLMVTEWVDRPDGLSLNVWLGAGDLQELIEMAPGVMAWAKSCGAVEVTIDGRPGWVRALKPLGFEVRSVTVGVRL